MFDHAKAADSGFDDALAGVVNNRFAIDTFATVRTLAELRQVLEESPFAGIGEDKLAHVPFLESQPSVAQFDQLMEDQAERGREKLAPGTRCLHIDFVDGVGNSRLTGSFIAHRLGCRGTARNVRSVRRIIDRMKD